MNNGEFTFVTDVNLHDFVTEVKEIAEVPITLF